MKKGDWNRDTGIRNEFHGKNLFAVFPETRSLAPESGLRPLFQNGISICFHPHFSLAHALQRILPESLPEGEVA
jgi:hypothetical protein